ncbi:AAA family ATPase [Bacillus sp. BR_7]|uniref:AAA family ATPase n=1 Tax=Bacillus TaxID=1386 RepID=UPI002079ED56|nr:MULTISPECIES: AAA family ATPase [Bacillus cereus group]MDA1536477.1 AAA family ATPase [Bacillus cereus group sp. TH254-2LC]USL02716.1 AAA family ATPase [Bacillus anthracis]HDR7257772.1 AAA family ATPase [Bacillus paranthracis]
MLRIKGLSISNINGIEELNLEFNNGFNFICGENGIGKTTILDCIASSFNRHNKNVRKNVNSTMGRWDILGEVNEQDTFFEGFILDDFLDSDAKSKRIRFKNRIKSKELINFSINRTSQSNIFYGNQFEYIQTWMLENYYEEKNLSSKKFYNLKLAKECFTKLDYRIKFSKVIERVSDSHYPKRLADIYLETPSGEIPFNFLSSGYRSCLLILLGVIKQTEITNAYKDVHLFDGVILIDELDLHLHPEWQAKLIEILKWLVPNAQIIATTHSPHIIQVAKQNEVIALSYLNQNNSEIINQRYVSNDYGFQGWTIEEILRDVMGMESSYSRRFSSILKEFDYAVSSFDTEKVKKLYEVIDEMLHPDNHLRKILKIQISSLLEVYDD